MSAVVRSLLKINNRFNVNLHLRSLHLTQKTFLKEIVVTTENNVTMIEGKYIKSDRSDYLLHKNTTMNKEYCALCPKELKAPVKYTDVLIISQFLDKKGDVLPQNITGLCYKAHCRLQRLLFQAQHAGLIDRPANHPDSALKWNKHNIYYDDHL